MKINIALFRLVIVCKKILICLCTQIAKPVNLLTISIFILINQDYKGQNEIKRGKGVGEENLFCLVHTRPDMQIPKLCASERGQNG